MIIHKERIIGRIVLRASTNIIQPVKNVNVSLICICGAEINDDDIKHGTFINGFSQVVSEISAICQKCDTEYVGGKAGPAIDEADYYEIKRFMTISYGLTIKTT